MTSTTDQPETPVKKSQRKLWIALIALAVLAVGGIVTGEVVTSGHHSTSATSSDSTSAPATTKHDDCTNELVVATDTWMNDSGPTNVWNAIGSETPIASMAAQQQASAYIDRTSKGVAYAENKLATNASQACSTWSQVSTGGNDPVVTEGQLTALQQAASANDSSLLDDVSHFADDASTTQANPPAADAPAADAPAAGGQTDIPAADGPGVADAPAASTPSQREFAAPSRNIGCKITDGGSARCVIAEYDFDQPGPDCPNGGIVQVDALGTTSFIGCSPIPVTTAGQRVLSYGSSLSVGQFTCDSAKAGITCMNNNTDTGFTLSRQAFVHHG